MSPLGVEHRFKIHSRCCRWARDWKSNQSWRPHYHKTLIGDIFNGFEMLSTKPMPIIMRFLLFCGRFLLNPVLLLSESCERSSPVDLILSREILFDSFHLLHNVCAESLGGASPG
jgi:hypothetical protein